MTKARRWTHLPSLVCSLVPGLVFAAGIAWLRVDPRFAWAITDPPLELFVIAIAGGAATSAGVADWVYHRVARVTVGPRERRVELIALGTGGVPLFATMGAATLAADARPYLLPILVLLTWTVGLVMFDEIAFHRRRCARFETALHRVLTLGHFVAFLAWANFVFVRGVHA